MNALQTRSIAQVLRALADPARLRIIQCLREGAKNVGQIALVLGIPLVNLSHHMRVLKYLAVVRDERRGRYVIYSLNPMVYHAAGPREDNDVLDFGCCRLDMPRDKRLVAERPESA